MCVLNLSMLPQRLLIPVLQEVSYSLLDLLRLSCVDMGGCERYELKALN